MKENPDFTKVLSKLGPNFWKRYWSAELPKSDEEYVKLLSKFEINQIMDLFSVKSKKDFLKFLKDSESLTRLFIFLANHISGISEYYSLNGYKKEKLTAAVRLVLVEDLSSFDNPDNPILNSLLLNKIARQQSYTYDLEPSSAEFHNKIHHQIKKRRRLVTYLHKILGEDYTLEHVLGDEHRVIIYIVRKKNKRVIPRRKKTVQNPNITERIVVIDWDKKNIRIPKYNRREITFFLSFFRFKIKIGIKKIEYADSVNPLIPENILDTIKEIRTQPIEELNASIHLKSETTEPIRFNDSLKDFIKRITYSKIKQLTLLQDGRKINMKIVSGNEFFFRPILSRDSNGQQIPSFGVELKKKHLKLDPNNLTNDIMRTSLDNLRVQDFEHPKIKIAVEELQKHNIVDFLSDQKRICDNIDCDFRREISYLKNRRCKYLCPLCREKTVFRDDVLTLVPKSSKIENFCFRKLKNYENNDSFPLDVIKRNFSFKTKKKRKKYNFIELCNKLEKEKRLNIFFADKTLLSKIRVVAKSQIIPYIIVLIGPIIPKDEREIKFSDLFLEFREPGGSQYITKMFEGCQKYEKYREELVEDAISKLENSNSWSEFEDVVFLAIQYLFPSCIKLGKMHPGKAYPDGFGRVVLNDDSILFGWDAKFTKDTYDFNEQPSKHYKYIDYLRRKGKVGYYFLVSNNLLEKQFMKVFDNRRRYKKIGITLISSKFVKDLILFIREEGYNMLDLDIRSKLLSIILSKMQMKTNYLGDFSLIKPDLKKVIDERKKLAPIPKT